MDKVNNDLTEVQVGETTETVENTEKTSGKAFGKKIVNIFQNLFSEKNRKKTILVLLAVVLVIAGIVAYAVNTTPKAIAERYFKGVVLEDTAVISKNVAYDYKQYKLTFTPYDVSYYRKDERPDEEEFFEKCATYYDEDITNWDQLFAVQKKHRAETMEDIYGKCKVTTEATREKSISIKKLKKDLLGILKVLEEATGFDPDTIKDCKIITVKSKIAGEEKTERVTVEVYVCKVNGAWKVLDHDLVEN